MNIAYFVSGIDPVAHQLREQPWSEIVRLLTRFAPHTCRAEDGECAEKRLGPAWGPYSLSVATRGGEHVADMWALVFDVDHISAQALTEMRVRIKASGYACVVHTTHSHTETDVCLRVIFPLTSPIARGPRSLDRFAAELSAVRDLIITDLKIPADPSTGDPSRQYFLPVAIAGRPHMSEVIEGAALDTPALLARVASQGSVTRSVRSSAPEAAPPDAFEGPADLDAVRIRLRRVRKPESQSLVRTVLRGEPLAAPGMRDDTVNRVAAVIAGAIPEMAADAALQIVTPSLGAMVTEPEGLAHWQERFRECYERARARAQAYRAQIDAHRADVISLFPTMDDSAARKLRPVTVTDPTVGDWRAELLFLTSNDGRQRLARVAANAAVILDMAPEWRGVLRFNALAKRVDMFGGPIPGPHDPNTLPLWVASWLMRHHGLDLPIALVADAMLAVARRHTYDPIANYLTGLVWDNTPRLDRMLEDVFGAVACAPDRNIGAYVRAVSARWMISAVARALDPGCQVDTVLILESERQGFYKSSALRVLGGEWSSSSNIDLRNKDARLAANSAWIIELAELDSFSRADKALAKGFFTDVKDDFRPPYGRAVESFPRRCVFVGTTNEIDYLTDRENRRYWPITIGRPIDLSRLAAERDQLWAEAVTRYRAGEIYYFPLGDPLWDVAATETAERRAPEIWTEQIREWWLRVRPENRPPAVTSNQIAREALSLTAAQLNRGAEMRVSAALRDLGFEYRQCCFEGRKGRFYFPPDDLRNAPQEAPTVSTAASVGAIETSKGSK